ncbi:MAG: hypothetical protein AB7F35_21820 [Acetobacteraceae bacterium]
MTDLHRLFFEDKAHITDREILVTARLNARVKAFAGQPLSDDIIEQVSGAIAEEADRLIAEGLLKERPDWLAAVVGRRLHVAFGTKAVQQLSRELRDRGAV